MSMTVAPSCISSGVSVGKAARVRREQRAGDVQMAALDRELQILQAATASPPPHASATPMRWQNMPRRIAHAARFVDHIGRRRGSG